MVSHLCSFWKPYTNERIDNILSYIWHIWVCIHECVCVNVIVVCVLVKTATELEWGLGLAELCDIPVLSSVQDTKKPCWVYLCVK